MDVLSDVMSLLGDMSMGVLNSPHLSDLPFHISTGYVWSLRMGDVSLMLAGMERSGCQQVISYFCLSLRHSICSVM